MSGLAKLLGQWSAGVRWEDLTEDQRTRVLNSLIDTIGVAISGSRAPEFAEIQAYISAAYPQEAGQAKIWGTDENASVTKAALANATAGHLMDFDDVHYDIHGHASTVIVPVIIAIAQERELQFSSVLNGYVVGVGVMNAASKIFGPQHYSVGWHSTSTCGVIGAAAAAAATLGLKADQIATAISAAASMSVGIRANFGTPLKPIHAGLAARAGIEAAFMAEVGILASPVALEGKLGAVKVYGDGSWPDSYSEPLHVAVQAAQDGLDSLGLKLYPCCRGSHYAVDAALEVYDALDSSEKIQKINVVVPLGTRTALIYDDPTSGLEAKFSLPYVIASALAHGIPRPAHFQDKAVHDPFTRELMGLIDVEEDVSNGDLSSGMEGRYAWIEVVTDAGKRVQARVDDAKGSFSRPLSIAEVNEKFLVTAAPLGADSARAALELLRSVSPEVKVSELFAALYRSKVNS
ncbi:MmgE/PrpD family protein [Glutamicibacter uratoxydans]|uniref:MmgE/PrpD family protein n=1 Tax=Glutamicibacter uratoxydans TaxID=43667 RepID=UPI003D6E0086